jgi:hypothetical protein
MINLMTLGALGFAAYRGTQLIVHDSILDGAREKMELWHARKFTSKPRTFIRDLLGCTYCTGFHLSWIAVLAYLLASGTWGDAPSLVHGIEVFSVAGIQALLNRWDDSRGGAS